MPENTVAKPEYAGLARRVLAIIYDIFLLTALLFVATAVAMIFNRGNAIEPGQFIYPFYVAYLLAVSFGFFGWFWTHGGQTLGMKTWKIKLQQADGRAVTWPLALVRFGVAMVSWSAAGLGFLWVLIHPQKRSWHDIASHCVLVVLNSKN